jgi:hypothetical protein
MLTILKRHLGTHASSFATSLEEPRYPLSNIYLWWHKWSVNARESQARRLRLLAIGVCTGNTLQLRSGGIRVWTDHPQCTNRV